VARRPRREQPRRTPIAEWVAATLGLLLTLGVLGYSMWEGLTADQGPPNLSVRAQAAQPTDSGYTARIVVRNASRQTAAAVEVRGVLEAAGQVLEERRAVFAYVPGGGKARGGLVFQRDPARHRLTVTIEGYEEP